MFSRYNIGHSLHSYFKKATKYQVKRKNKYNPDLIAVIIIMMLKLKHYILEMTTHNAYSSSINQIRLIYLVFFFGFFFSKEFKNFIS